MELQAVFQSYLDNKWEYSDVTILAFQSDGHYYKKEPTIENWAIFTFNNSPVKTLQYANINSFLIFSSLFEHDKFIKEHTLEAKN
jgi:hypothetical protein